MIDGFDDIKTIEVAPYYALLDEDRQAGARDVLQRYTHGDLSDGMADLILERIWNALVGNK